MTREPPIPAEATALALAVSRWREEHPGKVFPTWSELVGIIIAAGWTPPHRKEIRIPLAAVRDVL